jgi:dihydrofolate reductase
MRKLILFMHTSLDGFVAGTKGEMDWIIAGEEMFDYAAQQTAEADTTLYGRVTYPIGSVCKPMSHPGLSAYAMEPIAIGSAFSF